MKNKFLELKKLLSSNLFNFNKTIFQLVKNKKYN